MTVLELYLTEMDPKKSIALLNFRTEEPSEFGTFYNTPLSHFAYLYDKPREQLIDVIINKFNEDQLYELFHGERQTMAGYRPGLNIDIFKPTGSDSKQPFLNLLDKLYNKLGKIKFTEMITNTKSPSNSLIYARGNDSEINTWLGSKNITLNYS